MAAFCRRFDGGWKGRNPAELRKKFTGSRKIDGSAMIAYFVPLMMWRAGQNKGQNCGW